VNVRGSGGTWGLHETVVFVSRICKATLHDGNVRIMAIGTSVEHPSYSPDLIPCNFWAFPMFKYNIRTEIWLFQWRNATMAYL
jgi:hypothetical protein